MNKKNVKVETFLGTVFSEVPILGKIKLHYVMNVMLLEPPTFSSSCCIDTSNMCADQCADPKGMFYFYVPFEYSAVILKCQGPFLQVRLKDRPHFFADFPSRLSIVTSSYVSRINIQLEFTY